MNNELFELVEHTQRNIFLTGKAGTGKTTFLNDFVKKTQKKHIVVAPTGIAAINAGGVTIHSMFGLPLRTFLPTTDRIDANIANNISDLLQHFRFRKDKIKLLRELEVIIIDEVSMLRADVLDMIDFALRTVRRNPQKFGGVQMLFIGDLYQLPPVVRDEYVLNKYYKSPFFFDSHSLIEEKPLTIELMKVYRQKDQYFLDLLNAIREGDVPNIDFEKLNERYLPNFVAKEEPYVYLCSHNRMADEINREKLDELPSESHYFDANIKGDFKENQYPNEESLELRVGAQIMFIRNDASGEKKYFNGKLAEVVSIVDDEIFVKLEGEHDDFKLKREIWEQKKYAVGADKTIVEDVLGSYEQYPIRLAWAVTIHKSQGLTFDRLIIDAGKSFASGQVYVALSRCRTLEGIVLKSKISANVIFKDERISKFQGETNANEKVAQILSTEKFDYSIGKVLHKIDINWLLQDIENWNLAAKMSKKIDAKKVQDLYLVLKKDAEILIPIFDKFKRVLISKTKKFTSGEENWKEIEEKTIGATAFFFQNVHDKIFEQFKQLYSETKGVAGLKSYNETASTFLDDVGEYLKDLQQLKLLELPLFKEEKKINLDTNIAKIPSHVITFQMFEEGKSISDIAKVRGFLKETAFGHLAKFASQGLLDMTRIFSDKKLKNFEKIFEKNPETETLGDWKNALPKEFEFNEIRLLLNHFTYLKEKNEQD
ncbi:helix-turn-helix domain-containing protein [Frigoriflavimonas asaccharolytica]|uniref:GTPase SAR1 family protein n=1 Tax=Frigoriflavimonas asaccharolytica TaxID=2735899 RepID=A0A8J8GAM8_9FLAO|nr:helix-turn-helix domain-containing protein [Frigoriflavimonas asaccharolytica]NRS94011.1 GTPase SAR1 family protein [Frigoriflavimonas asaccharolytica]